ncbi:outer membrane protein transport protein [Robertkochia flava]|uniref:outer membrane protein transport protein n=1 Tax=Robertkochia flava TaxID=3447986 RepID=UPI001CCE5D88|nr:outer membrane protein transport protein [Robertkochia marina]
MPNKSRLLLCNMLLLFVLPLSAQDTHYWSQQFGTRSALMSGAVLGGADDNTMIYYNPGAMGFMENTSVSVNANAYRIQAITIKNALGDKADFQSDQLGSVPLLAGGMVKLKNERMKIGYGFMAPVDFDFKGIARLDGDFDVIDNSESPGAEELVAESGISTKVRELLIALGGGYRISDHWSVGVTNMFNVRSQTYNRSLSAYVFPTNGFTEMIGGNRIENVDFFNVRYYAKLGLAYRNGPWSGGLTLTTPSLNFFGKGTSATNISVRDLRLSGSEERVSGVGTDRQSKLKTKFKSPLSIALGVNYRGGRNGFGMAMEYFGAVSPYTIMEPAPGAFVRPASLAPNLGSDVFLNTPSSAKPVFNIALAYEYFINEQWTYYLSGRNDMSYFDKDVNDRGGIKTTISSWDIYHVTTGVTLKNERTSMSMGLLLSSGKDDSYEQRGNFGNPGENNLLTGTITITEANYFSAGILLGFTYYFDRVVFGEN